MRCASLRFIAVVVALLCFASVANAQVGSTTDIIMGKVLAPDSTPVVGARIEVTSNETGLGSGTAHGLGRSGVLGTASPTD